MPPKKKSFKIEPLPKSMFGGFSSLSYITTDEKKEATDPYVKEEIIPSRYLGKNMMVGSARSGRLPNVYFGKIYTTLASSEQNAECLAVAATMLGGSKKNKRRRKKGDEDEAAPGVDLYRDPGRPNPKERAAAKAKQESIHKNKEFKIASFPKKSTGPGSFVGCFQDKPYEHKPDGKPYIKGTPAEPFKAFRPKQIMTRWPHKGTYGVLGTTFGPFQSLYVMPEKVAAERAKEEARWAKKKAKLDRALEKNKKYQELLNRPVFKAYGTSKRTFDEKRATGVSTVYDHYDAPPEKPKRPKRKDKKAPKPLNLPTWRPSHPPKSGENGYFNKFANTNVPPDPAEEERLAKKKARAERAKARAERKKGKKGKPLDLPVWKPVSGPKSSVVSSLLTRFY